MKSISGSERVQPIVRSDLDLGPCSPSGACPGRLRPVLSADGTAWEAEQCDACNGRWWYQVPRSPSGLPGGDLQ